MGTNRIDLTGKHFGKWTVLRENGYTTTNELKWECQCECGTITTMKGSSLRRGRSLQCKPCSYKEISKKLKGLYKIEHRNLLELNKFYGRLLLLTYNEIIDSYECSCTCGQLTLKRRTYIINATVPSCGCYAKELRIQNGNLTRLSLEDRKVKNKADRFKLGARYRSARKIAKDRNVPFTLTKEEFGQLIQKPCVYGKNPLPASTGGSLDQLIPGLGYTIENSVPCCWRHNSMKGANLSYEDMMFLMEHRPHLRECVNYTYIPV